MSRRRIGQESFGFGDRRGRQSSLDELETLIDWNSCRGFSRRYLVVSKG